ncbi:MAG: FkbM family methyltransferase [Bacteroidota bacterium]
MNPLKRFFKRNSHNGLFKGLAGFGRSLHRLYENRNHDIYSNGELNLIRKLAHLSPKVVIDGGANVGGYAEVLYQRLPTARIYAFEPVPDTYTSLQAKVEKMDRIETVPKGLFSETTQRQIQLYDSHTHSSIYAIEGVNYTPQATLEIELMKGDDFLREKSLQQVDFLKLDIEGAEYAALEGFEQALEKGRIRLIQFEYGYINITTKKLLIDYYQFFAAYGYQVGKLFPKRVEFRTYHFKHEDFIGPNFVAVRKSDTELIQLLQEK